MIWDRTNRPLWLRCTAGVLLAVIAAAIRLHFLGMLESRVTFVTFFPAVAFAGLYGGFVPGLLATVVSAALADYFWIEPVGQFTITNFADLMSMVVFLASGTLMSYLAEATYRAQARAHKAEEQAKLAAERKQAEALLQRQAELLHLSYDAIIVWQLGCSIESWNKGAEELYGYSQEEAVGQVTHDLLKTIHSEPWPQIEAKLHERKFWEGELKHRTRDGREVIVSARLQLVRGAEGVERVLETNRDITERKRMDMEREVTIEILKIVNQSSCVADMVKAAATFFQHESGCEAVGIRLNEGEDFPYSEARGFPEEFIRLENSLCAKDAMGNIIRDSLGSPVIECMCGNVILGRVDPSKPFFSPGGSFWANSTTRLLAKTSDEDRQTRTRNRCNGEGYESVALIPLHLGTEHLGLIQLNDRRTGMFSPEVIALWERLAGYLAVAMSRLQTGVALRESEERFRVMANSIPQLAWIAEPDGYIYWYNQRWYEYTGTTPKQMEGWGWQSVHDPDALPGVLERWKESIASGEPFDMVFPLGGADGNFRQFLTRIEPVKNADGDLIQWCGTNTDITERKQMEDELRKARNGLELRVEERTSELKTYMTKLEQSNQALQDFASIASHDMKEPLRKVISFGNMLRQKSGESLGQSGNDYLDRMLHATERMQSLLAGLLDYSQVATASEPFKEVDLSDLVGEVLSDLEVRIVRTGGEVHVGTLPVISADHTQMRQLFQNLIGNALKFHKRGEKPMVQVRSVSKPDSRYQIIVEDSGIGFEEQYLDKIFAPFQR
ncbi:MAG: PAS domain S-box protein, partial [Syntrophobacteraceae bacterium]